MMRYRDCISIEKGSNIKLSVTKALLSVATSELSLEISSHQRTVYHSELFERMSMEVPTRI
jgi:hypothetical protein